MVYHVRICSYAICATKKNVNKFNDKGRAPFAGLVFLEFVRSTGIFEGDSK